MHSGLLNGKLIKYITKISYRTKVPFFSHDHIELLVNAAGEQLFFRSREGPWMPTLRLFHRYPVFLPKLQVDKGAIRFVLSGANIMCPGLTSPGAFMNSVDKGTVVAIMAEGKENCLAIGLTTLSTEDM
jgi:malignant T-cell-amplified sequence